MHSNGNSFSNGQSMDLGSGASYGVQVPDGSRPASVAWLFAVTIFRI
jgi:hypothetical protein